MDTLLTLLILSFASYAIIKWWFETSLLDHVTHVLSFGKISTFGEFKGIIGESSIGAFFVELFECPWCLTFHVALWLNIIFNDNFDIVSILATAGGSMLIYSRDMKD